MLILVWSYAVLALFKYQYSYDVLKYPLDSRYINISSNGSLVTCIYPSDKPFKVGSPTLPRAEIRSIQEWTNPIYNLTFTVKVEDVPSGTDYSLYQIFGGGSPLLMIRHRKGFKEMVAFDGSPKIQRLTGWPNECVLDCKRGRIKCDNYLSTGSFKCSNIYYKLGIYAQGQRPGIKLCSRYGSIRYGIKL